MTEQAFLNNYWDIVLFSTLTIRYIWNSLFSLEVGLQCFFKNIANRLAIFLKNIWILSLYILPFGPEYIRIKSEFYLLLGYSIASETWNCCTMEPKYFWIIFVYFRNIVKLTGLDFLKIPRLLVAKNPGIKILKVHTNSL